MLKNSYPELDVLKYVDNFIESRKKEADKILYQGALLELRKEYPEWHDMVKAVKELLLKSYIKGCSEGRLETYAFLLRSLELLIQGNKLNRDQFYILRRLQKKFELTHKVFDYYDRDVHKGDNGFKAIRVYVLLSLVLNMLYFLEDDINAFNTATKVTDLILKSGWPMEPFETKLVGLAILLEGNAIRKNHER